MPDFTWQALYSAALSETNAAKLLGRVEAAQRAIHRRLEQLDEDRDARERKQLEDALHALFTLAARRRSA